MLQSLNKKYNGLTRYIFIIYNIMMIIIIIIIIIIMKKGWQRKAAMLAERDKHPISPKTPAPQYQPIQ